MQPIANTYRAAVIEFPVLSNSSNAFVQTQINVDWHVKVMQNHENIDLDIIVFPESVLNTPVTAIYVPKPDEHVVACDKSDSIDILKRISCAVRELNSYAVIHFYIRTNCAEDRLHYNDVRPCTDAKTNENIYNAAIAFDRQGAVIAVYESH